MKTENKHSNFKVTKSQVKNTGFKVPMNYFNTVEEAVLSKLSSDKFSKKNGFNVPDNYFNSLEDIVLTKLKAEAIQKNSTNTIPDNYFATVEDDVLNKIKSERKPKVIHLKYITKIVAPIAIAASLLLLMYLNTTSKTYTLDNISTASIENYFEDGENDIDILSIASLYTESELEEESYDSTITNTEVEKYLSKEDLEDIIYEN